MGDQLVPVAAGIGLNLVSRLINPGQKSVTRNKVEAQRLEELGAPDSSYGYPIRELLGVCKVEGCSMIWARPLREEITTDVQTQTVRQGKGMGGSRQTTITETETATYYMTAAFLIGGPINRLERVWANGVQIWNRNDDNEISNVFGGYTELYFGDQTQPSPTIVYYEGEAPTLKGWSYIVFNDYPIELYKGSGFPRVDIELYGKYTETNPERLFFDNAITHITSLAGIDSSKVNLNDASANVVMYGATFNNNGETYASYLDDLANIHGWDYYEVNGTLVIYNRQDAPYAIQIPLASLGTRNYSEELDDLYIKQRVDPLSVPSEVNVEFLSRTKELSRNNVSFKDPTANHSNASRVTTRIVTNEQDMVRVASRLLYQAKSESLSIEDLYLLPVWAGLRVGDFIGLQEKEINRIYRITEVTIAEDYRVKINAVAAKGTFYYSRQIDSTVSSFSPIATNFTDLATIQVALNGITLVEGIDYTVDLVNGTITPIEGGAIGLNDSIEITITGNDPLGIDSGNDTVVDVETDYVPQTTAVVGTASLFPLDIPLINDSHDDGTLYVAVKGDANWIGGGIFLSRDNGVSYERVAGSTVSSITGMVGLAIPAGEGIDETTVIRVSNVDGQLSSVTQSKFDLNQGLLFLVGDEIIMARDANLVAEGVYDLSYLRRGCRGTEWANNTHLVNEQFYLLSGPLVRIKLTPDDIGKALRLKAVGLYGSEPAVTNYSTITFSGANYTPYSPVDLAAVKDQGDNVVFTWQRRDRHSGWKDVPTTFTEAFEFYRVEILDGATVTRTFEVSSASVTYTAADQIQDFGSYQSSYTIEVYQQSSVVGVGNPGGDSLTPIFVNRTPTITAFSPTQGSANDTISIYGLGLSNAVGATIDGTPLDNFSVVSDNTVTGTVAEGTTTGKVSVVNSAGSVESVAEFTIVVTVNEWGDITGTLSNQSDLHSVLLRTRVWSYLSAGFTVPSQGQTVVVQVQEDYGFGVSVPVNVFRQSVVGDPNAGGSAQLSCVGFVKNESGIFLTLENTYGIITETTFLAGDIIAPIFSGDTSIFGGISRLLEDGGYTSDGSLSVSWGGISGTLSGQSDLQTALDGKMDVSAYDPNADGVVTVAAKVNGIDTAGSSKYYGTNNLGAAGFFALPSSDLAWGDITGTLSSQTDLNNALNAKFDSPTGTINQYIRGDGTLSTFPSIPTTTSDLTNDSGFLSSVSWGIITGKPTFATVATSGSYNDLTDKPAGAEKTQIKQSISTTKSLNLLSEYYQLLTPTVASVIVKLPIITSTDYFECEIVNISTSNALEIQENDGTAIVTLENANDKARSIYVYWDNFTWQVWIRGYY